MKTVAIISEYNPFHTGHEYQIRKIREELGSDTRIIAIMSGNYTQRGEIAFIDKFTRAKCAVLCGVNLVLELPFPFSSSSAEFFAKSGVSIANALSCVDYLSFGSECGDINLLSAIAKNMLDARFIDAQKSSKEIKRSSAVSAEIDIYNSLFEEKLTGDFFSSNNILALEYLKALIESGSKIKPHTIKRIGSSYNQKKIEDSQHQSATAIRAEFETDKLSAIEYLPNNAKNEIINYTDDFPCDIEKISSAIISKLRIYPFESEIHDLDNGLYNRLKNASFKVNTIKELILESDTKKYPKARIRRAVLNSFFGVTSSIVRRLPQYTQLLATDSVGQTILKEVKKSGAIPVLTKPSRTASLSPIAKEQKDLSDVADSIFELTKPKFKGGNNSIASTPFIMKNCSKH